MALNHLNCNSWRYDTPVKTFATGRSIEDSCYDYSTTNRQHMGSMACAESTYSSGSSSGFGYYQEQENNIDQTKLVTDRKGETCIYIPSRLLKNRKRVTKNVQPFAPSYRIQDPTYYPAVHPSPHNT